MNMMRIVLKRGFSWLGDGERNRGTLVVKSFSTSTWDGSELELA